MGRCNRSGHYAKDCTFLSFYCTSSAADRRAEAAKKSAEWERRQVENVKKQAEWKAKQAEKNSRQTAKAAKAAKQDSEVASNATEASTIASLTVAIVDEAEVERMAAMDKEVRKLTKVLREIEKLEGRSDLDVLQRAKVARREEIELQLGTAKGLAKAVARDQLRRQLGA